jgi:2-iminobutanoate/2-iminopropanoate deaminase
MEGTMPDSELKRHHYPSLGDAVGPYVHATEHNGTLYTSGFTAFGTDDQHLEIGPQLKAIYNQLSAEVYGEMYPASAMVQVAGLFHPDLKAEVEAVVSLT